MPALTLSLLPGTFGVARLPSGSALPKWISGKGFWAVVNASDELTLVCDQTRIPSEITCQRDWACLRTIGPFAFDESGIVAALIAPLSAAGLGVFVLCTFDGEHLMVAQSDLPRALDILTAAGHTLKP